MTFEEIYKDWLTDELSDKLSVSVFDGTITSSVVPNIEATNDLQYEPLKNNPTGIAMIMSVGNTTQTNIPNIHFTTDFLNIRFLCAENKKSDLFTALDEIRKENNAVFQTLTEGTDSYDVQMAFNKPYVVGNPYDMPTDKQDENGESETIGIIAIQLIASVVFSDNLLFGAEVFTLSVGGTVYNINGIIKTSWSNNPNSILWQREGYTRAAYENAVLTSTYSFVIQALKNDALCQIIEQERKGGNGFYGKNLILNIDGTNITISDYILTKDYEGGVSAYTITLIK